MKNKDFIVDGKKIGYFDDGMIVVTDPEVIKENQTPKTEKLTFGEMVEMLKHGNYMTRKGWVDHYGNTNCVIYLVESSLVQKEHLRGSAALAFKHTYNGDKVSINPHIDMKKDNSIICGWTPTTEDILTEDWYISNP